MSDDRDNRTHAVYVGFDHSFTPTLSWSLRAGGQYADYFGNPSYDNSLYPYVVTSLSYVYAEQSSCQLGLQHMLSAADLVGSTSSTDFVQDDSTTTVYGSIIHRIMPNLFGTLLGTYQHANYNGGGPGVDNEGSNFLEVGVDLSYRFNPNLSAHTGYNYDKLNSDIPGQGFSRNRVYVGVTAQY